MNEVSPIVAASGVEAPSWLEGAVFYQIFPERFANGDPALDTPDMERWGGVPTRDNFFGGDFAGITAHLDHIESLGANAIYLTPIFEAETNHRYDAIDYFKIDHRLGDLAAFKTFLDEAHKRGIKVVLDAVFNHCGIGHWAFRDVIEKQEASRYINWFSVESFPVTPHPVPNYKTCSGCWYLPKWNAYNPEVRKHHLDVTRYWIEQGIDGWRLDVPYFINENFWRGFRTVVKDIDPDLYIVAEEWREPESWLQGDLADGTMNYTLRNLIFGFTAERNLDAETFATGMAALRTSIPAGARRGMLNLLGSHDTTRLLTHYKEDARAAIVALTLMITSEGAPMIYYGDEIGMLGENDPGCRQTMEWDESRWNGDLLAGIKDLFWLRRNHPVLQSGDDQVVALSSDVVVRLRRLGDDWALVVANRSEAEVRLPATVFDGTSFGESGDREWTTSAGLPLDLGHIREGVALPPLSAAIYFSKGPVA